MIDWLRFKNELQDGIRRRFPRYDFRVDNFGNEIRVTLFRAPIKSDSRYFPFGKLYIGLQNRMSPEMFEFWATVDKIRRSISPKPDFKHPDIFQNFSKSYDWKYSIGSANHSYIDSNEFLEKAKNVGVSEQLKKDVEFLEKNEDVSEEKKTSSIKLISNELKKLANKLERRG